jgi:hypothetical protein
VSATCADLEAALRGDDEPLVLAFRRHAETCAACREELALWEAISAAAPWLRKDWPSPGLAERIRADLRVPGRARWRPSATVLLPLAAAACLVLAFFGWRLSPSPDRPVVSVPSIDPAARRLLTEQALDDVERAQDAYVQAIASLQKLADPRLADPDSAVVAAYREKLLVLDAAIDECRAQAERNRFNAHLRLELLSIYQEKQRTLESLLREDPHAS